MTDGVEVVIGEGEADGDAEVGIEVTAFDTDAALRSTSGASATCIATPAVGVDAMPVSDGVVASALREICCRPGNARPLENAAAGLGAWFDACGASAWTTEADAVGDESLARAVEPLPAVAPPIAGVARARRCTTEPDARGSASVGSAVPGAEPLVFSDRWSLAANGRRATTSGLDEADVLDVLDVLGRTVGSAPVSAIGTRITVAPPTSSDGAEREPRASGNVPPASVANALR